MKREKRAGILFNIFLAAFFIVILINFSVHLINLKEYNQKQRSVFQGENTECTISLYPRGGVADSWDKRDVEFQGSIVTFTGTTYDCEIKNFSKSLISDWSLRINVLKDCYINNSWCGTVEIHQNVGKGELEKVQTLDLRDYDKDSITLDHFFITQDLYIPLKEGDYVIYIPSTVSGELPVTAFQNEAGKTVIGFIFYHLKGEPLSFFSIMSYRLTKGFFQGTRPKVLLGCLAVWIMLLIVRITFVLTFSNIKRETNSVIHAISRIYYNLYKVNLEDNSFQEIQAVPSVHNYFEKFSQASEAFKNLPQALFSHEHMDEVQSFFDLSSWKDRLKYADNSSADFKAVDFTKEEGSRWIRSNLIVCKRNYKKEPVEVICGMQDVDAEVSEREQNKLMMERYATDLSREVAEQTLHIQEIQRRIVSSLGDMIGSRDGNTGGHVKRTSDVMKILVTEIIRRNERGEGKPKFKSIDEKVGEDIIRAAPMHDLGKIFIDTSILCKPAKLTEDEYTVMKTHSSHSGDIVNLILREVEEPSFVDIAYNVARYHHERWDGKGYPEGEAGGKIFDGIPVEARIMAVADVYDALVSKRCYKEAMSFEKANEIMLDGMGKQFDPDLEDIFKACRKELEDYYSDNKD